MSNQEFTPTFREALWKAHNRKCLHCGREILYSELRIDHLLPEYLHYSPFEREEVLALIGLPAEYDILGKQNLAPSCAGCNEKKGTTILAHGRLAILIAKVRDKISEVERRESERNAAKELDGILRSVALAVDSGAFSVEDLKRRLDEIESPTELKLEFVVKFEADEDEPDERTLHLDKAIIENMRRRRITLAEVTAQVRRALENPGTKIDRRSRSAYMIRGRDGLRVVFETWRNNVYITSAFIH